MKKIVGLVLAISAVISLASCSASKTLGEQYPGMYEEKPLTIAIMPPINRTIHAEAKDYFYTTMYKPLCEKGYYVYSPYLTMELFQQESAYDAEMFLESDLSAFRKVLNADACMFTIIKDWRRVNVGGMLKVNVEYVLRSTKTGQTLYNREGAITLDTSIDTGARGWGALVDVIATTINTAATDKIVAGRKCTAYVLKDLPSGKYSNMYEKDAGEPAGNRYVEAVVR